MKTRNYSTDLKVQKKLWEKPRKKPVNCFSFCTKTIVTNCDTSVYPKEIYSIGSERSFVPKWKQLYPWLVYNFEKRRGVLQLLC